MADGYTNGEVIADVSDLSFNHPSGNLQCDKSQGVWGTTPPHKNVSQAALYMIIKPPLDVVQGRVHLVFYRINYMETERIISKYAQISFWILNQM